MDESGIHDGSPVITASAVWATPERWAAWGFDWALAKHPVEVVHAVDCHNLTNAFAGWTRERRNKYVGQLLPTIGRHKLHARIAGYHREAYVKHLQPHPEVRRWLEDPYHIAFMFALGKTWPALLTSGYTRLEFIHEVNAYQSALTDLFAIHCRRNPGVEATLSFGTKQQHMALQCADGLAYEGNHQLRVGFNRPRASLELFDPTGTHMAFVMHDCATSRAMAQFLIQEHARLHNPEG